MKKNKKLSDVEWEALYERSLINAKYMKSMQDITNHPFND